MSATRLEICCAGEELKPELKIYCAECNKVQFCVLSGEYLTRHNITTTAGYGKYRCLVCGVIIKSSNPDALIEHLRVKHPFINVARQNISPVDRCLPYPCPPPRPNCPPKPCFPPCPPPQVTTCCAPCPKPCPPRPIPPPCPPCPPRPCPPPAPSPLPQCPPPCAVNCPPPTDEDYCRAMARQQRRELRTKYKCTVESWRPGCTKVVCPCCGCEAQPVIRRQHHQMANSSLGACVVLGCWPLSFLPFLCCESNMVNLYCAQCNNFLGAYNQKLGCVVDVEANLCNPGVTPNFPSIPH